MTTNRRDLADFLRHRRDRVRREEFAQLAGMSGDYYLRLEQARGP